jgi:hypothetical protein
MLRCSVTPLASQWVGRQLADDVPVESPDERPLARPFAGAALVGRLREFPAVAAPTLWQVGIVGASSSARSTTGRHDGGQGEQAACDAGSDEVMILVRCVHERRVTVLTVRRRRPLGGCSSGSRR